MCSPCYSVPATLASLLFPEAQNVITCFLLHLETFSFDSTLSALKKIKKKQDSKDQPQTFPRVQFSAFTLVLDSPQVMSSKPRVSAMRDTQRRPVYMTSHGPAHSSVAAGSLLQLPEQHPSFMLHRHLKLQLNISNTEAVITPQTPAFLVHSWYMTSLSTQLVQTRNSGSLTTPPSPSSTYAHFLEVLSILPPILISDPSSVQVHPGWFVSHV